MDLFLVLLIVLTVIVVSLIHPRLTNTEMLQPFSILLLIVLVLLILYLLKLLGVPIR